MDGHCLPIDPFYLAFKAREHDFYPEFIELAGKVNRGQPAYCVDRIARALNERRKAVNGSEVLLLGVSYKPGVGDVREAPSLEIATLLRDLGAEVAQQRGDLQRWRLARVADAGLVGDAEQQHRGAVDGLA